MVERKKLKSRESRSIHLKDIFINSTFNAILQKTDKYEFFDVKKYFMSKPRLTLYVKLSNSISIDNNGTLKISKFN